jgi:hypothetical protein
VDWLGAMLLAFGIGSLIIGMSWSSYEGVQPDSQLISTSSSLAVLAVSVVMSLLSTLIANSSNLGRQDYPYDVE